MRKLKDMTDEELVLSYLEGDNRAFDLLLSRNQSKVFSYIYFVVHDRNTANDLFQDTFVKIIMKLQEGKYVTEGKFAAWMMRVTHNVIMDWYRSQRQERTVEPTADNDLTKLRSRDMSVDSIESLYVNNQIMRDVRNLLEALPATQREVVYMRFYQEMSFKEIAETTNVSINTALGRMRYAVLNMRRMAKNCNIALQPA